MLFNSGNPNLLDYTRFLVNDPTTAASTQYTTQEVKDAVNLSYFDILAQIKSWDPTVFQKISYANTINSQKYYLLPSGFVKLRSLYIDHEGKNLSSDTTATRQKYDLVDLNVLDQEDEAGTSGIYLVALLHQNFAIYPTTNEGGTSSMELTYEFEPTLLSADTDPPIIIPTPHHILIAYGAASNLRIARDLDTRSYEFKLAQGMQQLKNHMAIRNLQGNSQFTTVAFNSVPSTSGKQGIVGH